jgi:Sec-independent protein translocase protein TatA
VRKRDPWLEGLAGQKLPTDGKSLGESMRRMRKALHGGSTKAMAAQMGMSDRQARRYMAGEVRKPPADRMQKVADEYRNNPDLRRAAVKEGPGASKRGNINITVTGNGGPVIGDSDHSGRPRPPITLSLTPDAYGKLADAFADGGGAAAMKELNKHGGQYLESFEWSTVDNIQLR